MKNKINRLELKDAILKKLQFGGEYTYNELKCMGASVGLVSSVIHAHLHKMVDFRTEPTGSEEWERITYISLKPKP